MREYSPKRGMHLPDFRSVPSLETGLSRAKSNCMSVLGCLTSSTKGKKGDTVTIIEGLFWVTYSSKSWKLSEGGGGMVGAHLRKTYFSLITITLDMYFVRCFTRKEHSREHTKRVCINNEWTIVHWNFGFHSFSRLGIDDSSSYSTGNSEESKTTVRWTYRSGYSMNLRRDSLLSSHSGAMWADGGHLWHET